MQSPRYPERREIDPADHAIVIGAGIGGLLAARVLSDRYRFVTVLDRDELPAGPAVRRGVPQGRQVHGLLAKGMEIMTELFPGLSDELEAAGVPSADLQAEMHWHIDGRLLRPGRSGLIGFGVSRALLEYVLRQRVGALGGVAVFGRCAVMGPLTTDDRSRVTGVTAQADGVEFTLEADLVVDAGGRGTRSPVWLERLAYQPAEEEVLKVDLTYVSCEYERSPGDLDGRLGSAYGAYPGHPLGGFVLAQEGDRFLVGLSGWFGSLPPMDQYGMAAFADKLRAPDIAELIRTKAPLGPPAKMKYPGSIRRRYESLERFPAGYLVFGDALCSFNPFYGQGMTVAALEARILAQMLDDGATPLAARFFREAATMLDTPWGIAASNDLRFGTVAGRRTARATLLGWYLNRYKAAAAIDPVLSGAFLRVTNLIAEPASLLMPALIARVLLARLRKRSG
ncbi:FAD-dependent oxidoreductase [Kribbella sp. NPDC058693]|uniref:FAD-dependent oxidoreductase n=1 Tax=Kribbella sp. NPDC058693 TaxID=3346602 RepID=UPI003656C19A